ncbi:hypothetical protein F2Q69_00000137 [Brassica cretica]|uniref:Uncharacterized protein n=1 Tax=Brassica cretica TaxID=69181 RepID=A0A8S9NWY5_BRACR|nr:hypothetical protein F2Q69_00000137 [Brassica cretica]
MERTAKDEPVAARSRERHPQTLMLRVLQLPPYRASGPDSPTTSRAASTERERSLIAQLKPYLEPTKCHRSDTAKETLRKHQGEKVDGGERHTAGNSSFEMRGPRQSLDETNRGPSHHHALPLEHLRAGEDLTTEKEPHALPPKTIGGCRAGGKKSKLQATRSETRRPLRRNTCRQTKKLTEI